MRQAVSSAADQASVNDGTTQERTASSGKGRGTRGGEGALLGNVARKHAQDLRHLHAGLVGREFLGRGELPGTQRLIRLAGVRREEPKAG